MFVQISKKNKLITDVEILNNDEIEVYYLEDFDFFENHAQILNFDIIIKK